MRCYFFVIDSFGVGADQNAARYQDEGSNTALHVSQAVPGVKWSFLSRLGLGNVCELQGFTLEGCPAAEHPLASFGVLEKKGAGKDTSTGHWKLAGLESDLSLTLFPPEYPSFPPELVTSLEQVTGRRVIGNCSASGTEIIQRLGEEERRDGSLICYTSADSVLQIAAHEDVIPHENLYDICRQARAICDRYGVGRVIARPFTGDSSSGFVRTPYRRDFSIALPGRTYLEDWFPRFDIPVIGVGKISDLFNGQGLSVSYPEKGNQACWAKVMELAEKSVSSGAAPDAFYFINLVDTDMLYGHRRDPVSYCQEMERISQNLESLYSLLPSGDVLCVTADHGCDPCFRGTDHTRECVPELLAWKNRETGQCLGRRDSFAWAMRDVLSLFRQVTKGERLTLPWQEW